jgi:hypothetical protein
MIDDHFCFIFDDQTDMDRSVKNRKGGPFKLHLHPKYYFDGNPYKSDRCKYWLMIQ